MQQLKIHNSLLMQLVKGLESQISSKTRENKILFQQYERLSAENANMAGAIDSLRQERKQLHLYDIEHQRLQKQVLHLKQRKISLKQNIKELLSQLEEKQKAIALLQSQIIQLRCNQGNFSNKLRNQEYIQNTNQLCQKDQIKVNIQPDLIVTIEGQEKGICDNESIKQNKDLNKKLALKQENLEKDTMTKQKFQLDLNEQNKNVVLLNLQRIQTNNIIQILHEQSDQKEESFNYKPQELQTSFQFMGKDFQLESNEKKSLEKATQAKSEEIQFLQELKRENNSLKQLVKELKDRILILQEEDKIKNEFLQKEVLRLQAALRQKRNLANIELNQKNQIISQLEATVLQLEKNFNSEIMQLRKNNAELRSQILSLNKKLYLLDPNAIDLVGFVRDTCKHAMNESQFYKSHSNYNYSAHFNHREKSSLTNYVSQKDSSRRYDHYFTQKDFNLGEKIMGRHCRGSALNFGNNTDFKINGSVWQVHQSRPF